MFGPLTAADFPLYHVGALVYRRTESSPLFTAATEASAADLVERLNRDERVRVGVDRAAAAGEPLVVWGRG